MTSTPSWAMTYQSLCKSVLQWLERSDQAVVDALPIFISMAEFEIAQQLKTLGQTRVAQSEMTAGNPVIKKPARWRKTVSMNLIDGEKKKTVLLRKYEYIKTYSDDVNSAGLPLYYADYDAEHWIVGPTPDKNYEFETIFYERISPLSSSNQTNYLTQNAPNLILWGTLVQAGIFLKNEQITATFQKKYELALMSLKAEDVSRVGDRSAVALDS